MTSALEGGEGVVEKWTRVLISCVIMYVTRGGRGSKNSKFSWTSLMEAPLAQIPNLKITKRGGAAGRFGDYLPVENTMKLKLCPLICAKVFWDIP